MEKKPAHELAVTWSWSQTRRMRFLAECRYLLCKTRTFKKAEWRRNFCESEHASKSFNELETVVMFLY